MAETKIQLQGWPARGASLLRAATQQSGEALSTANSLGRTARALAVTKTPRGRSAKHMADAWTLNVQPQPKGARLVLGNTSPHAVWVLKGTKAHRIPKTGTTLLAWQGGKYGAGWHYARYVKHPGTKANPIDKEVMTAIEPSLKAALSQWAGRTQLAIRSAFR